jgi:uncharacterized protein with PIN domain
VERCRTCETEVSAEALHQQCERLHRLGYEPEEVAFAMPRCPRCMGRLLTALVHAGVPEVETAASLLLAP